MRMGGQMIGCFDSWGMESVLVELGEFRYTTIYQLFELCKVPKVTWLCHHIYIYKQNSLESLSTNHTKEGLYLEGLAMKI